MSRYKDFEGTNGSGHNNLHFWHLWSNQHVSRCEWGVICARSLICGVSTSRHLNPGGCWYITDKNLWAPSEILSACKAGVVIIIQPSANIHVSPQTKVLCFILNVSYIDHPCSIALFEVIQHSRHNEVGHNGCVLKLIEWAPTQNKLFWHQRECFEPLFSPFQVSEGIWLLGQNAPCVGRLVERSLSR